MARQQYDFYGHLFDERSCWKDEKGGSRSRIQKEVFRSQERELSRGEYQRLLEAAWKNGDERLYLIMQTICATGIRISELAFITVSASIPGGPRCLRRARTVW